MRSLTPQAHPDSIILEDAELSVEEVMKNVDRIMCDMRKRAKVRNWGKFGSFQVCTNSMNNEQSFI